MCKSDVQSDLVMLGNTERREMLKRILTPFLLNAVPDETPVGRVRELVDATLDGIDAIWKKRQT